MGKGEGMGNDRANDLGKLNDLLFEELARLNAVDAGAGEARGGEGEEG